MKLTGFLTWLKLASIRFLFVLGLLLHTDTLAQYIWFPVAKVELQEPLINKNILKESPFFISSGKKQLQHILHHEHNSRISPCEQKTKPLSHREPKKHPWPWMMKWPWESMLSYCASLHNIQHTLGTRNSAMLLALMLQHVGFWHHVTTGGWGSEWLDCWKTSERSQICPPTACFFKYMLSGDILMILDMTLNSLFGIS